LINKKRLVASFIKYVKVDSLSKQEKKFSKILRAELSRLGIRMVEDNAAKPLKGDCGNLFGTLKGNVKNAPRILLNAHIDTVVPGIGIKPVIRKGVIRSDGKTILGADNKAGVVAIMEVLRVIKEKKIPHGDIDVLFTVAEEIGLCGAKFIDKKFLKADFGLVLDGGDIDKIINKAPSQDSIEVEIIGKAAHAGVHPEDGINAIKVAGIALSKMKLGRIDKETTSNIGIINGGLATNIVPDSVILKGEARSHNIKKMKGQVEHMRNAFNKACKSSKAKLKFKVTPSYRAFEVSEKHKAIRLAKIAANDIGIGPKIKATGGGSDANIFNSLGLPCIILGVGADNVHTNKENVAIKDLVKGTELVLAVIRRSI
jgi:tripeptide aminopeptidase